MKLFRPLQHCWRMEQAGSGKHLLILGAGGGVGAAIVEQALAAGHRVRALEREWKSPPAGVEAVEADAMAGDLTPHVEGVDAVLSGLGLGLSLQTIFDPPELYTRSTRALLDAMRATGCRRLIVISAAFVDTDPPGPAWFHLSAGQALKAVFAQMAEMEQMLEGAGDIDWTAVRPAWLLDAPASGDYRVQADTLPDQCFRTRTGDLADFMLKLAVEGGWERQRPAIARREPGEAERPTALIDDLKALMG
ncbi:NAD(P)-dependent oxidoreductase [Sphingomonas sp.]